MGLIAIGDIHGCARSLDALLDALAPSGADRLVFLGDYVDRGEDSRGVIDRLLDVAEQIPCVFLRGNHEAMMLEGLAAGGYDAAGKPRPRQTIWGRIDKMFRRDEFWLVNGGKATLDSYGTPDGHVDLPPRHLAFLHATRLYHREGGFFFVHAGLDPELTVRENVERGDEDVFLWDRSHLEVGVPAWEETIVCGHTPHPEPIDEEHLILIDTGCVYHGRPGMGRLTAVRLPERTFVSVPWQG